MTRSSDYCRLEIVQLDVFAPAGDRRGVVRIANDSSRSATRVFLRAHSNEAGPSQLPYRFGILVGRPPFTNRPREKCSVHLRSCMTSHQSRSPESYCRSRQLVAWSLVLKLMHQARAMHKDHARMSPPDASPAVLGYVQRLRQNSCVEDPVELDAFIRSAVVFFRSIGCA